MLPRSKRDVEASIACVRAVLQTDHVIHLFAMVIHDLVKGPAFLSWKRKKTSGRSVAIPRCWLMAKPASEQERDRERDREPERESASRASSSETTVFDEEGEEGLTHCCRHTHTQTSGARRALFAGTTK